MKKQVVIIPGGDCFGSYGEYIKFLKDFKINLKRFNKKGWKENLSQELGRGYEVILPRMPNSLDARYLEWRIWFKKLTSLFRKDVVFIGYSLGGIFIAKYLAENKFPRKIRGTFLVGAPYDHEGSDEPIMDFKLPKSLARFAKQGGKISIYQSQDDPFVPFSNFGKYKKALPDAHAVAFKNKGHFGQERFPELAREIKKLFK